MFKLLTEEEKKKVQGEYFYRRTVVMLAALSFVLIFGTVELFPSYILSSLRKIDEEQKVSATSQSLPGDQSAKLKAWLLDMNKKLSLLSPNADKDRPSLVIERAIRDRAPGIKLIGFTLTKDKDGNVELNVSGLASDRQAILDFQQKLNASGDFSDVSLPVSNLAKDSDIPFEMKLTPKQNA